MKDDRARWTQRSTTEGVQTVCKGNGIGGSKSEWVRECVETRKMLPPKGTAMISGNVARGMGANPLSATLVG